MFRYKPNPDQLESKLEGDSSSSEEEGEEGGAKSATAAKFKPPQNVPQFFAESKTGEEMDREGDDILLFDLYEKNMQSLSYLLATF